MRKNISIIFIALLLPIIIFAQTETGRLQVAVYPFEGVGLKESTSTVITNAVFRELIKSSKLAVRDQNSTEKALEQIGIAQSGHCSEDACKIEAGKILKAQKLIMGSVELVEDNFYTISIRVVDVQTSKTEFQISEDCQCSSIVQVRDAAVALVQSKLMLYLETGKKPAGTTAPPSSVGAAGSAPIPGKGIVTVTTTPPGAEVSIDSKPMGKTPISIPNVDPGIRELTISIQGYAALLKNIEVRAGMTTPVNEILSRQSGILDIQSAPSGADVWLDETPAGKTPLNLTGVGVGPHKIRIQSPQFRDYSVEVHVSANQPARINAILDGAPGKLTVTSSQDGAEVFLDGKRIGLTPFSGEVSSGSHALRVSKEGFDSSEMSVAILPNVPSSVDLTLQKTVSLTLRVAVVPWVSSEVDAETLLNVTQKVHGILAASSKIAAVELRDVQSAMLSMGHSNGCMGTCAIDLGNIVKADKVVVGTIIHAYGKNYGIELEVKDVKTGQTEFSAAGTVLVSNIEIDSLVASTQMFLVTKEAAAVKKEVIKKSAVSDNSAFIDAAAQLAREKILPYLESVAASRLQTGGAASSPESQSATIADSGPPLFSGTLTQKEATKVIMNAMQAAGYKCYVRVFDQDKNGIPDIMIANMGKGFSIPKNADPNLLDAAAKMAADLIYRVNFEIDKIIVANGYNASFALPNDVAKCAQMSKGGASGSQVDQCYSSMWQEIKQYGGKSLR